MSYPQRCITKKTKDIKFKVFDMITNKNKGKKMTKNIKT